MKYKYAVDKNNRLIIKPPKKTKPLATEGKFGIDKNNRLIYWLNEPPAWRRLYGLPNKIAFEGNWRLNPNYDLELNLAETKDQYKGDHLLLKGEIISVDRDTLVFEINSHSKRQGLSPKLVPEGEGTVPEFSHIQLLKLTGFWQADEFNRISFAVKKKALPDVITLEGAWQINENQQITYTYEKTNLKRKTKILNTLTFTGFWQITSANRLTYILSHSSDSRFDFRVQIETPNLYPKEGIIKYRLGIGLKGLSPTDLKQSDTKGTVPTKIISLYGAWKFSRKRGLVFQMDYGKGKVQNMEFEADIRLSQKDKLVFALKNKMDEPLGMSITFTHRFLKRLDAETFLRLKKFKEEAGIEVGLRIPF